MLIYVINLHRRPERLDAMREELKKQGLNAKLFTAIDSKIGWQGCRDSHLAVLDKCQKDPFFIILEDDCTFVEDISYLDECVRQLPKEWDCLYLGGSPRKPQERYSDNLFKANGVYTTHAILWHTRKGGAVEYILSHKDDIEKIDNYFASVIQPLLNCYLSYPLILSQTQTQSDTCRRSDTSTIIKNFNAFCK
jgi:GR25 family glycosyltransferase involved in LPS biosynthesis